MGEPLPPRLLPHHGGRSWTSSWYGPDRGADGRLRRHCARFGKEGEVSKREANNRFRRWFDEKYKPMEQRRGLPSVDELAKGYYEHAQTYYRKDGAETSVVPKVERAMRILRQALGSLSIADPTPAHFAGLRDALLKPNRKDRKKNLTVATANDMLYHIRHAFVWGMERMGVPPVVTAAIKLLAPLRVNRTPAATPSREVKPVAWELVEKTLPKLPENVQAMVRLQWLAGMRPGEVRYMRPCDIIDKGDVWEYWPHRHKTQHHGKSRVIVLGPEAKKVLAPYLTRRTDAYCFSPSEARKQGRRVKRGDLYGSIQYLRVITRACESLGIEAWHPNQLRHSAGTRIAAEFGLEHAADVLGHATVKMTRVYAERSLERAAEVAKRVG